MLCSSCEKEGWETCERNRHQGQWRRRGSGCSRRWIKDSPAANGEDYGDTGCPPAAQGGPQWSSYPPCSLRRTPYCSRYKCPEGCCIPWRGGHAGAGFLSGAVTHARAVLEELQPTGRTHFGGGLYSMRGTPHWGRGRVWRGRSGRENALWTDCNLCSPATLRGRK